MQRDAPPHFIEQPDFAARRFGVATPEEGRALSGREFLQAIVDGRLPQPPISQALNFWLVAVDDGFAAFEGDPGPALLNPMGIVHGGWALTLIDSATGSAGGSLLPAGVGYTTIETKGNLSRPITPATGRVRAEGRVVVKGRQLISCEGCVKDRAGSVLAHGTSTLMVLLPRTGG